MRPTLSRQCAWQKWCRSRGAAPRLTLALPYAGSNSMRYGRVLKCLQFELRLELCRGDVVISTESEDIQKRVQEVTGVLPACSTVLQRRCSWLLLLTSHTLTVTGTEDVHTYTSSVMPALWSVSTLTPTVQHVSERAACRRRARPGCTGRRRGQDHGRAVQDAGQGRQGALSCLLANLDTSASVLASCS